MIDIHSHIIYGVDDGSPTIKESIKMVLEAERLGIKAIVATPHYHRDIYGVRNDKEHFDELCNRVKDCGVELYKGYEVFINQNLPDRARSNPALRLNGSSYLLLELPFDVIPAFSHDVIYEFHLNNIIPIIAHPERNRYFVNNFSAFIEFVEKGCLLQLDAASIIGVYGSNVRKFTKQLITLNLAHFVASDAHSSNDYLKWYLEAKNQITRWAGEEYADKLFYHNAKVILEKG